MSEEEKKAIELLSKKNTEYYYRYVDVRGAVSIVLNLIEKQAKEIETLKIRNEMLDKSIIQWNNAFQEKCKEKSEIIVNSISKDKIKEKIKNLQEDMITESIKGNNDILSEIYHKIKAYQELL